MAGSADEGSEAAAFRPEHEGREEGDSEDGRVGQAGSFGEEDMEGEDIDHDGAEDEETEAARARECREETADDFEGLHEGEVSGWVEGTHEEGGGAAFRGLAGRWQERDEEIEAEENEGEAEQCGGGMRKLFHEMMGWLVGISGWWMISADGEGIRRGRGGGLRRRWRHGFRAGRRLLC